MTDPHMTDFTTKSHMEVELVNAVGGDDSIVHSARVSVVGRNDEEETNEKKDAGLINYLMREKHGSPFEHNSMTFYVAAPIFVFREFHRHRIGFSYNEMSGRYTKLPGEFYIPDEDRNLVNIGTASRPEMGPAEPGVYAQMQGLMELSYDIAWMNYEKLIKLGVANEVARAVLPVGIYSQMYVTANARSIMSFLSLRTHHPEAAHVSRPQREIEMVAEQIEAVFAERFPITYAAYVKNGRVAP